jgi:murein DD-endopeptidase MepM/ murein hydrolase activator NlpD
LPIFKPRRYGSFSERLRGLARIGWFCGGLAAILLVADHLSLAPSGPAVEIVQERAAAPADGDQATTEALSAGLAEAARSSDKPREQATSADTVARDAAEAMALPPRPLQQVVAVRRGDTLMDILLTLGISRAEAHEAVSALSTVYDVRGLRPGQEITFTFAPGAPGEGQPLAGAWFAARADRDVGVARDQTGRFVPQQHDKELTLRRTRARGTVATSLYEAGLQSGVPANVMSEMIRIFSFDVDFQRDIQPGDAFDVFYDLFVDAEGKPVRSGTLAFASLTLSGKTQAVYRFVDKDGQADFYNDRGESVRKALLKTPIDGARLTSGFGNRMHPILGYSAFHKGVEFGAPAGTPIQAAGDGVVEQKGWNGGYGNYIRIRHGGEYATAYAHLSRFAAGVAEGARIRQGQIIGYVGSTGRSTGPHLHYEILRRGAQVNPVAVKFPTGRKLDGGDLARFRAARVETDRLMAQTAPAPASNPPTLAAAR